MKQFFSLFVLAFFSSTCILPNAFSEETKKANEPSTISIDSAEGTDSSETERPKGRLEKILDPYWQDASAKFDFGITNLGMGWTQLITKTQDEARKVTNSRWKQFTQGAKGTGKGLIHAVTDTVGGIVNTVTFLIPKPVVPLPENGVDTKRVLGN